MKVKDLLPMEIDVDVVDDVCEELCIAFCGPVKLTEEGQKQFADALELDCELNEDDCICIVNVDDDEGVWQKKLKKAKKFFYSAAGYCNCDNFDKWFDDADD